jgi:carboxymethylenebutenolidase
MGGRLSLSAAGHFPDRIAAAASYHGGGLATDSPDSPHRLAPAIKARVYIGAAIEDRGFDDAQKQRLEQALTDAGIEHTIETYQARHGWVPRDTPVHDPVATERHWQTLLELLERTM